ncbi:uncharacterized protein MYCFIDRAFT_209585 [Pseudocercospora fijiensis CIRAD86]|uniref:SLS1 C-terminal domain-containing protein n=1 Tax=Pseudocercospora fijiensis (strain CIRAD86) TaxID=383855 RepID=N1Q651_PSEFD|nr:uncharacterized protein MYCFIDRAFT_209585 [Pseudocercospora fijiensis CIRAD86]EME87690.1 hypothetical protein MYCFIDRAFT_209585 [Pseudocercospora fijiensis CIRAD86]
MASTHRLPDAMKSQLEEQQSKSEGVGSDVRAQAIAAKLQTVNPALLVNSPHPFHADSYWDPALDQLSYNWSCSFSRHLQDSTSISDDASSSAEPETSRNVYRSTIPGLDALLSYFDTATNPRPLHLSKHCVPISYVGEEEPLVRIDWALPYLSAILLPLPNESLAVQLPRIELRYNFTEPTQPGRPRDLFLTGLKADIDHQNLIVPLPDHAVDLNFSRSVSLVARAHLAKYDKHILYFTQQIQRSIFTGDGVLTAPTELTLRLPRWLVHPDADRSSGAEKEDISVTYLFERFKQTQRVDFAISEAARTAHGVDSEVQDMAMQLPSSLRLKYSEADGGAIHGNSSTLTLLHKTKRSAPKSAETSQPVDALTGVLENEASQESTSQEQDPTQQLAESALRIAHLLTRINAGTLSAFRKETEDS